MDKYFILNTKKLETIYLIVISILAFVYLTENWGPSIPMLLWAFPMLLSYKSPKISFFFLIITQLIPSNASINLTQLFFVVWIVLNFRSLIREGIPPWKGTGEIFILLFLLFFRDIVFFEIADGFEFIKIILFAIIAHVEISRIGDIEQLIPSFICATFVGAAGYYGHLLLGLDFIINSDHISYTSMRGGFARFMIGNGDYNFYAVYLLVGFSIVMGLLLNRDFSIKRRIACLCLASLYVFPILASLSRGAFITMCAISFLVILRILIGAYDRNFKVLILLLIALTIAILFDTIQSYFQAALSSEETGSLEEDIRFVLWKDYLEIFKQFPLFGGLGLTEMPRLAAHNTFVEFLTKYGILISLYFFYISAKPILNFLIYRNTKSDCYLFSYISVLFAFLSLSIIGFKVFWLLILLLRRK